MSISLYRKYRPQTFSEVIGQKHIVQTLSNAIANDRIGHAYLFTGPRGTGKTTLARIFAKTVNCTKRKGFDPCLECEVCKNIGEGKSLDIFEIDAASNTGVDNIRELRENVKFPPSQAKFKVYIIDEVHMLSTGAFNALLKTLEEPPAHVIFILATTEIHKVPDTIISRCQRFDFTRLSLENIIEKLSAVAKNEKIKVEKEALEMIAIASEGGMRDAESLFSQVIALEDKSITAKEVEEILGTTKRQNIEQFAAHILDKNIPAALNLIDTLSKDGYDLEVLHKSLLNYLRQLMLLTVSPDLAKSFSFELTSGQIETIQNQAKGHTSKEIMQIINCFSEIQGKIKSSFIPQLPLELATVKAITIGNMPVPTIPEKTATIQPIQRPQIKTPETIAPEKPTPIPTPTKPLETIVEKTVETQQAPKEESQTEPVKVQEAPSDFSLSLVDKNWPAISEEIKKQNHSLATLLPTCRVIKVSGSTVTIAAKYPFHKDKLKESQNQLTVETAFAKILGFAVRISAVTMEEAGIAAPQSVIDNPMPTERTEPKISETSSLLSDAMGIMGGSLVE